MPSEKYTQKILIVEDEPAMLKALTDGLLAVGFSQVIQARDGEEGLQIALEQKPDIILLDIIMPRMDGRVMLKKLRGNPECKDTRVIFLTNLIADESILKNAAADDLSYYLVKTEHSLNDVIQKIKTVLGLS